MARRSPLETTAQEMLNRCHGGFRDHFHRDGWLNSRWHLIQRLSMEERNNVLFAWVHSGPDFYGKPKASQEIVNAA